MESTYTTKQGDVWDKIAYEVYGDEEYTGWLMENNFPPGPAGADRGQ